MLYPAIALVEGTNLSVGRGTEHAFRVVGAPFIDGAGLGASFGDPQSSRRDREGHQLSPTRGPLRGNHGPRRELRAGRCPRVLGGSARPGADRRALRAEPGGLGSHALDRLVAHRGTLAALAQRKGLDDIEASWREELAAFEQAREKVLLY